MKRKLPLFVMIGVAGVLVPVLAVLAQSSSPRSAVCCSSASCTASKSSAPSSTDNNVVDELIAILKETKSEETFIVTAMALGRMGPEAKRALPQLIRNAERLELFEDLFDSNATGGDREIVRTVAEAIITLAETSKDSHPAGSGYPVLATPYPGSYGPPATTPGGWNQPQAVVVPSTVPACPSGPAGYPVTSSPVAPETGPTPGGVPTSSTAAPSPLPTAKKASPKSGKYPVPVPATRSPSR